MSEVVEDVDYEKDGADLLVSKLSSLGEIEIICKRLDIDYYRRMFKDKGYRGCLHMLARNGVNDIRRGGIPSYIIEQSMRGKCEIISEAFPNKKKVARKLLSEKNKTQLDGLYRSLEYTKELTDVLFAIDRENFKWPETRKIEFKSISVKFVLAPDIWDAILSISRYTEPHWN